jgi:hypothetical protein
VRPDQRQRGIPVLRGRRGAVAEAEGEVLAAVDEAVEAVDPGVGGVAVGEPQGQRDLGADRRGGQSQRHDRVAQSSWNREERA